MIRRAESEQLVDLESAFLEELRSGKVRVATETAYTLAIKYGTADIDVQRQYGRANYWAHQCVHLLDSLPSDTLADCAPTRTSVSGVQIPNLMHSANTRERLQDLLAMRPIEY